MFGTGQSDSDTPTVPSASCGSLSAQPGRWIMPAESDSVSSTPSEPVLSGWPAPGAPSTQAGLAVA